MLPSPLQTIATVRPYLSVVTDSTSTVVPSYKRSQILPCGLSIRLNLLRSIYAIQTDFNLTLYYVVDIDGVSVSNTDNFSYPGVSCERSEKNKYGYLPRLYSAFLCSGFSHPDDRQQHAGQRGERSEPMASPGMLVPGRMGGYKDKKVFICFPPCSGHPELSAHWCSPRSLRPSLRDMTGREVCILDQQ